MAAPKKGPLKAVAVPHGRRGGRKGGVTRSREASGRPLWRRHARRLTGVESSVCPGVPEELPLAVARGRL